MVRCILNIYKQLQAAQGFTSENTGMPPNGYGSDSAKMISAVMSCNSHLIQ